MIPPLIGSAIIGGASDLVGSLLSHVNQNKVIKVQQQENQLNRNFNAQQALLNREFQEKMFDKQNDYNNPKAVISRMQAAGLNPALAYGGFADSASSPSGSAASASGSVNPPSVDYSGIGSAGNALLQGQIAKANSDLANAQTNKLNEETNWIGPINEMQLKLDNADLTLRNMLPKSEEIKQNRDLVDGQLLKTQLEDIQKRWALIKPTIDQMEKQNAQLDVLLKYADAKERAALQDTLASVREKLSLANFNDKQAWQVLRLTPAIVNKTWAEGESLYYANLDSARNNEVLQQMYDAHKSEMPDLKFDEFKNYVGSLKRQSEGNNLDYFDSIIKALGVGAGIFFGMRGFKGPRPPMGPRNMSIGPNQGSSQLW